MLDMGFRPAVDRIVARLPADRQTLFFSATLEGEAGTTAPALHDRRGRATSTARRRDAPPPTSSTASSPSAARAGVEALVAELAAERELALVFVRTKRGADRLVKRLGAHGVTPPRSTATSPSASASRRSRGSSPARSTRSSPPTSPRAGSTSTGISHVINFDPPGRPRDLRAPRRAHRPRRPLRASASRSSTHTNAATSAALANQLGIEHGLGGGPAAPVRSHANNRPRPQAADRRPRPGRRRRSDRSGAGQAPAVAPATSQCVGDRSPHGRGGRPPPLHHRRTSIPDAPARDGGR